MIRKTFFCFVLLCIMSVLGFAQINKHSFGGAITNGFVHLPGENLGFNPIIGDEMIIPDRNKYVFGIAGSYVNATNKWLAWRTNLGASLSSRNLRFDGGPSHIDRYYFVDLGFGPIFTYQREDFGLYIGGSLDLNYWVYNIRREESLGGGITRYPNFPNPTFSTVIGYWQRVGNVNSPWYFEVSISRRYINDFFNTQVYYDKSVLYHLNLGFRYELKN
jgi:hypothetical protein